MATDIPPLGKPLAELIPDALALEPAAFAERFGHAFFMRVGDGTGNSRRPADTEIALGSGQRTGDLAFQVLPIAKRRASTLAFISIGRLEGNDVALGDNSVSKLHASVKQKDGAFLLHDERSRNGTFVDGQPVATRGDGPPTALTPRCTVRLGSVHLVFLRAQDLLELARGMGGIMRKR